MEKIESNSINSGMPAAKKQNKHEERAKIEKVVKTRVTTQKKSLIQKFGESFFDMDGEQSLSDYVFNDVLMPALKDTIADMVIGAIDMAFYGSTGARRRPSRGGSRISRGSTEIVSYDRFGDRGRGRRAASGRERYDVSNVIFSSRQEADQVLDVMCDWIERYEAVTVGDFYEACGIATQTTDFKYGWYNLGTARIHPSGRGYVLEMPRVEMM